MSKAKLIIVRCASLRDVDVLSAKVSRKSGISLYRTGMSNDVAMWAFKAGTQEFVNYRALLQLNSITNLLLSGSSLVVPVFSNGLACSDKFILDLTSRVKLEDIDIETVGEF